MMALLEKAMIHLQRQAKQSQVCVAILLYEAHTLIILALQSTMHQLGTRRLEIGNLLANFFENPVRAGSSQWDLVAHLVQWKGGAFFPVYAFLGRLVLIVSAQDNTGVAAATLRLGLPDASSVSTLRATCVRCCTTEINGVRPCPCCDGDCPASGLLHCRGALRIVTHSTSGRAIHDISECGKLTPQRLLELHELTNVCLVWTSHVLHPDLLFAYCELDYMVLLVLRISFTDNMTKIRPLDQCKASKSWTLTEFIFWDMAAVHLSALEPDTPSYSAYDGRDNLELSHRN
eukprot:1335996-Amphidinium_carterae.3